MIVLSFLLVIVGAVLLLVGFFREELNLVYGAIGAALAAGLFLIIGVIRSRPARKPVPSPGGATTGASWAGATPGEQTAVLDREEEPTPEVPAAARPAFEAVAPEPEPEPAVAAEEDVVVVPKPTARAASAAAAPAKKTAKKAAKKAAKKTAKKAAAKKTAKKATAKKTGAKKATAKKTGAKKIAKKTAKKATKKRG